MMTEKEEPSESLFDALTMTRKELKDQKAYASRLRQESEKQTKETNRLNAELDIQTTNCKALEIHRAFLGLAMVAILIYIYMAEPEVVYKEDAYSTMLAVVQTTVMLDTTLRDSIAHAAIQIYRDGNEEKAIETVNSCWMDSRNIKEDGPRFVAMWDCRIKDATFHLIQVIRQEQKGVEPHLMLSAILSESRSVRMMEEFKASMLYTDIETEAMASLEPYIRRKVNFTVTRPVTPGP